MSALSRLPRTPATGIVHKWVEAPAYGQVRVRNDSLDYCFLVLCRVPDLDTWSVLLLSPGPPEITEYGTRFIEHGTRVVTL